MECSCLPGGSCVNHICSAYFCASFKKGLDSANKIHSVIN